MLSPSVQVAAWALQESPYDALNPNVDTIFAVMAVTSADVNVRESTEEILASSINKAARWKRCCWPMIVLSNEVVLLDVSEGVAFVGALRFGALDF